MKNAENLIDYNKIGLPELSYYKNLILEYDNSFQMKKRFFQKSVDGNPLDIILEKTAFFREYSNVLDKTYRMNQNRAAAQKSGKKYFKIRYFFEHIEEFSIKEREEKLLEILRFLNTSSMRESRFCSYLRYTRFYNDLEIKLFYDTAYYKVGRILKNALRSYGEDGKIKCIIDGIFESPELLEKFQEMLISASVFDLIYCEWNRFKKIEEKLAEPLNVESIDENPFLIRSEHYRFLQVEMQKDSFDAEYIVKRMTDIKESFGRMKNNSLFDDSIKEKERKELNKCILPIYSDTQTAVNLCYYGRDKIVDVPMQVKAREKIEKTKHNTNVNGFFTISSPFQSGSCQAFSDYEQSSSLDYSVENILTYLKGCIKEAEYKLERQKDLFKKFQGGEKLAAYQNRYDYKEEHRDVTEAKRKEYEKEQDDILHRE